MRDNFIDAVNNGHNETEILELFYLYRLEKKDVDEYSYDVLSNVAHVLFGILSTVSTEEIIDIIETNKERIPKISTRDIPMFSDLRAVDMVPGIAQANPGATFPEIGAILLPNNKVTNQRKWGETHYRLAAMMNLVENGTKAEVTFLGKEYAKLAKPGSGDEAARKRDILRPKLCLCSPCIQLLLVSAYNNSFNAMQLYREMLTEHTAVRRRSCTKQMLKAIFESCSIETEIERNLVWK